MGGSIFLGIVVVANIYLFRRYKWRRHERGGLMGDCDAPLLGGDDDTDMIM